MTSSHFFRIIGTLATVSLMSGACSAAGHGDTGAGDAVHALSGRTFQSPPPANAQSSSLTHIHLTPQDLYKPPAPASAAGANGWGAAGAGIAPLVASGPAPVYTTMAAASAAGVTPFPKPTPVKTVAPATPKETWTSRLMWLGLLAAVGVGRLLVWFGNVLKQRNRGD